MRSLGCGPGAKGLRRRRLFTSRRGDGRTPRLPIGAGESLTLELRTIEQYGWVAIPGPFWCTTASFCR
jgi:hypothetical protein